MTPFQNPPVAKVFAGYPPHLRRKLLALRERIFETAPKIDGVGEIEETLKWGEPAYVTGKTRSGSTVRRGWKKSTPGQSFMYFICTTNLIETFKTIIPHDFKFEGNRALVFSEDEAVPMDSLAICVAAALTYQRDKRSGVGGSAAVARAALRLRSAKRGLLRSGGW